MEARSRKAYPTDATDEEWAFCAPYLALLPEDAGQRRYALPRSVHCHALDRSSGSPLAVAATGTAALAGGLPADPALDRRGLLRSHGPRSPRSPAPVHCAAPQLTAVVLDPRTLQSMPQSGHRGWLRRAQKKRGSKTHVAVDTLGNLLALVVTPASEQERFQVEELARTVQEVTGERVELAYADQGYTGNDAPKRPRRTASDCRWSSTPKPSAASSCCHAAGWWRQPSHTAHI
jgi:transposase